MTYDPNWREHQDLPGEIQDVSFEFTKPELTKDQLSDLVNAALGADYTVLSNEEVLTILIDATTSWAYAKTVRLSHQWIKLNVGPEAADEFMKDAHND